MARGRGAYRLNKVLNRIVPSLMFLMIYLGSKLVLNQSIPYLFEHSSSDYHYWIKFYKLFFISQVSLTAALYLAIYLNLFTTPQSRLSGNPTIQKISDRSIIYQCVDHTGSPLRCTICNDQIIPIRARHCLDCELCVPGFDHHCVWFAQCISITNTLKPFIQVLILGATAILTGAIPIYPIVLQHVRQVIRLTWSAQSSGDTLRKIWWNRWWGWAGGPVYRYIGGLCLGYIYYPEINLQDPSTTFTKAPHGGTKTQQATKLVLSEPTLSALLIVLAATMVLGVILAMLTIVLKNNILNGLSTLEIERARQAKRASREAGVKLWVPSPASDGQPRGKVIFVPPDLPIFDLGPKLNFQHIMGKQVWHWFVPWTIGHLPDGVEWPISDKWIDYLRSLDVYHEGEL
ncbi:hypothetical protein MJO28_011427 [Puccinia striiformis f. sp. tritici]|uniref:Palmitoyltransferase n=2 Tax=Puccinia striiformis f. sp. tritici TaxID=168172 RepID=A0A0L0VBJ2_9BASI|nr:hypothetical protein Pst134EB_021878 [Puccinia striiformis f. sp. tritici]KAI7943899.1 hypothetical protein MJO28_011427 [Puccinia striiformis f. sp. tritici]KAI9612707.1 hypothetical protein H4Q26_007865 [Puccinia striiformis f. sp. tritici PST-130]KNE96682.1 hypothetical protein PSTG_10087 [Puccinia striiformis f. sp. tritici PST-78]